MMKRLALHILHHEIEDAFGTLAEVRHVNDVRMADGSSRARLALETRDGLALLHVFIRENVRADGLDRDSPRDEILIARQIDLSHRAAPQTLFEQVASGHQGRARQRHFRVRAFFRADEHLVFIAPLATRAFAHNFGGSPTTLSNFFYSACASPSRRLAL